MLGRPQPGESFDGSRCLQIRSGISVPTHVWTPSSPPGNCPFEAALARAVARYSTGDSVACSNEGELIKTREKPVYSRSNPAARRRRCANRRSANRLAISVGLVTAVWLTAVSRWIFRDAVVPWDSKNQFYAFFRFLSATLRAGEWPFWNLYHYGGHPSVADPQSLVFSPVFVAWGLLDPVPTMRAFELDDSESLPRANARNESGAEGFVPTGAISMLMTKEPRTAIRTPRGWAISVLHDAAAIRECEYHGSMQDRADPHARDRAVDMARQDPPPPGVSPDAAVARCGKSWI